MIKLSDKEIQLTYNLILDYHSKFLDQYGVKLPKLRHGKGYTKGALTLVYLAQGYPYTRIVSKSELTEFIRQYDQSVLDVQQARHLAAQKGWFIISGTRNDMTSRTIAPGEYQLQTMEKPYPGFTAFRREEVADGDYWEQLKMSYDYRCAVAVPRKASLTAIGATRPPCFKKVIRTRINLWNPAISFLNARNAIAQTATTGYMTTKAV